MGDGGASLQAERRRALAARAVATLGIKCGAAAFDAVVAKDGRAPPQLTWNDTSGELQCSVLFLYPEFFQSDFVEEVGVSHTLYDQLAAMFPPAVSFAPWDRKQQYTIDQLEVYYEIDPPGNGGSSGSLPADRSLRQVNVFAPLVHTLTQPEYVLPGELPTFHVVVQGSAYRNEFRARYKRVVGI